MFASRSATSRAIIHQSQTQSFALNALKERATYVKCIDIERVEQMPDNFVYLSAIIFGFIVIGQKYIGDYMNAGCPARFGLTISRQTGVTYRF